MLVSFIKQGVGGEEVKFKKVIVVANISRFQPDSGRDVLICFILAVIYMWALVRMFPVSYMRVQLRLRGKDSKIWAITYT